MNVSCSDYDQRAADSPTRSENGRGTGVPPRNKQWRHDNATNQSRERDRRNSLILSSGKCFLVELRRDRPSVFAVGHVIQALRELRIRYRAAKLDDDRQLLAIETLAARQAEDVIVAALERAAGAPAWQFEKAVARLGQAHQRMLANHREQRHQSGPPADRRQTDGNGHAGHSPKHWHGNGRRNGVRDNADRQARRY